MYEIFDKLCKERGYTASRVSKETGISTSDLTSWKKGIYAPKKDKMEKIANIAKKNRTVWWHMVANWWHGGKKRAVVSRLFLKVKNHLF